MLNLKSGICTYFQDELVLFTTMSCIFFAQYQGDNGNKLEKLTLKKNSWIISTCG